jgi:hypothetical protein
VAKMMGRNKGYPRRTEVLSLRVTMARKQLPAALKGCKQEEKKDKKRIEKSDMGK